MWKGKRFNKLQLQETAKFFLSSAQGAFIVLLAFVLSDEPSINKAIFAFLIVILIYCLYKFAMYALEVTPTKK